MPTKSKENSKKGKSHFTSHFTQKKKRSQETLSAAALCVRPMRNK